MPTESKNNLALLAFLYFYITQTYVDQQAELFFIQHVFIIFAQVQNYVKFALKRRDLMYSMEAHVHRLLCTIFENKLLNKLSYFKLISDYHSGEYKKCSILEPLNSNSYFFIQKYRNILHSLSHVLFCSYNLLMKQHNFKFEIDNFH